MRGWGTTRTRCTRSTPIPKRDRWRVLVLPVLKRISARRLVEETGLALGTIKAGRNGQTAPHAPNRAAPGQAAAAFFRGRL